jgi:hypothetical protein
MHFFCLWSSLISPALMGGLMDLTHDDHDPVILTCVMDHTSGCSLTMIMMPFHSWRQDASLFYKRTNFFSSRCVVTSQYCLNGTHDTHLCNH